MNDEIVEVLKEIRDELIEINNKQNELAIINTNLEEIYERVRFLF